jgi:hypothetical protein
MSKEEEPLTPLQIFINTVKVRHAILSAHSLCLDTVILILFLCSVYTVDVLNRYISIFHLFSVGGIVYNSDISSLGPSLCVIKWI